MVCKYFLPDWSLSCHPFNWVFCRTKLYILMKSNLSIFFLMDCAFGAKSKTSFSSPRSEDFFPFFLDVYIVSMKIMRLRLRGFCCLFFCLLSDVQLLQHCIWKYSFPPYNCFCTSVRKSAGHVCVGLLLGFVFCSIELHVHSSTNNQRVLLPVATWYFWKLSRPIASTLFFLF